MFALVNTGENMKKDLFTRGVEEIIVKNSFEKKLKSGKKLRIKFGIDPTATDLHLGHTVALRKLKNFQDLGHQVVLIIGDFTATIGDPTARQEARKILSRDEVKKNMKTYLEQIGKVLDLAKTEVRYNSEWYDTKDTLFLFELSSKVSVQRVLKRDDFQKRLEQDRDIAMLETLYPLLQGYDSVCINADIEIGGTDQKFNLLMGRKIQKSYNQPPQDIMTLWLLEGTDGIHKMSKSFGNFIGICEEPCQMYGKIMSISDDLIVKYFRLLTDIPTKEVDKMSKSFKGQISEPFNPRQEKARLAYEIVKMYHSTVAAKKASDEFDKIFSRKELPTDIPKIKIKGNYTLPLFLIELGAANSNSEARRLIEQGALKIDGTKILDPKSDIATHSGMVVQVGKKKYYKIK